MSALRTNFSSKLKQGWLNLLNNENQIFSTTRNVNNISLIRSTIKRILKKKDRQRENVECQSSRMKKDERAVQDIESCLEEFDTKPFETSNPVLHTPQSVIVASDEVIIDLKKAIREGDEQISFLNEESIVKSLQFVTPFLKTKGSTSQMTRSNKYWVEKKKKLIKWKRMD